VNRPALIPGLPRTWRGPREIQFGSDPSRALSIELADPRAAQILDLLDGTRSERAALQRAAELDVPADQARALLEALQAAGLVVPAADLLPTGLPPESRRRLVGEAAALAMARKRPADILRRRSACRVVVTGHGRLGASIAVALAEAGVGQVEADIPGTVGPGELAGGPLRGADLGRPRRKAISDAVLRAAPGLRSHSVRAAPAPHEHPHPVRDAAPHPQAELAPHPQLELDSAAPAAPASDGAYLRSPLRDSVTRRSSSPEHSPATTVVVQLDHYGRPAVPHLAVTIRDGTPVIGPFVPAAGGPCLGCLDLHRKDRDPAWPGPPRRPLFEAVEPCAVATLLAATAFATAEVLTHLDGGRPQTLGAAVEITAPGHTRRRRWPPHPACRCAAETHSSVDQTGPTSPR
jgi:hypothetical protein